jgi:pimeloyl-ACP methyl ester carboxylesterase
MKIEILSLVPEKITHPSPILFVHGAWHGAWCWEKFFMPYFAAQGFAVHALSLRGHGGSEGRRGLRRYRVKDYVKDVRRVASRLPRPPILVGHSLGGHVVQKYLEAYPSPAAVLLASVPVGGIVKMLKRLVRNHPWLFFKVNLTFSLYPFVATAEMAREMLFSADMTASDVEEYHAKLQDESYSCFLDMLAFAPIRPQRVTTPVLVVGAENDNVFYRRDIRKTGRAYHHKAVILPGASHDIMLDKNWRRAADVILAWLELKGMWSPL